MRRVSFIAAVTLMTGAMAWAAPFRQGDLVIYRIDDGSTPLTNTGNYAFLDEYTTNGTLVQTIPLPTNGFIDANGNVNYPIQNSGAATSEGYLNLSTDGRYLVFAGYATNNSWSAFGRRGAIANVDRCATCDWDDRLAGKHQYNDRVPGEFRQR